MVGKNLGLSFFQFIFPFHEKNKQLMEEKATDFEVPLKICGLTAQWFLSQPETNYKFRLPFFLIGLPLP